MEKKNIDKINELQRIRRHYQHSWGGDPRRNNNLLKIDVNLFNTS